MHWYGTDRKHWSITAMTVLTAASLTCVAAGAAGLPSHDGLSPAVARKLAPGLPIATPARGSERVISEQVIVELSGMPTARDCAALHRAGAVVRKAYSRMPMAAITISQRALPRLAALPIVRWISPDLSVRPTLEYACPAIGARGITWSGNGQTGFTGTTGKGIGVAVVDSGIEITDDIWRSVSSKTSRVVAGYDWITNSTVTCNNDTAGHGTCVAGIIAGNGWDSSFAAYNTRSFIGVAPEANLIDLRVLDQNGQGTVSNVISAINWAISNRSAYNIRVLNLSLGHPPVESYTTDPLCQACESAWKAGILVVCAAGNRGRLVANNPDGGVSYGTIDSPGIDPYVLTVGAVNDLKTVTRSDDVMASYSSRGPTEPDLLLKPDLVAPGNKIIAMNDPKGYLPTVLGPANVVPTNYYCSSTKTAPTKVYFTYSGTSMAAPMVSGAAALLFQANPALTPDLVKARLMVTADKSWRSNGTADDIYSRGAGYLNIPAALASTYTVTGPALSPLIVQNSDGTVDIQQPLWGDQAIWSKQALWGDQAIWGKDVVDSDQAIWSKSILSSDQAIWSKGSMNADFSATALNGD